jgi:hypothetical protein
MPELEDMAGKLGGSDPMSSMGGDDMDGGSMGLDSLKNVASLDDLGGDSASADAGEEEDEGIEADFDPTQNLGSELKGLAGGMGGGDSASPSPKPSGGSSSEEDDEKSSDDKIKDGGKQALEHGAKAAAAGAEAYATGNPMKAMEAMKEGKKAMEGAQECAKAMGDKCDEMQSNMDMGKDAGGDMSKMMELGM